MTELLLLLGYSLVIASAVLFVTASDRSALASFMHYEVNQELSDGTLKEEDVEPLSPKSKRTTKVLYILSGVCITSGLLLLYFLNQF